MPEAITEKLVLPSKHAVVDEGWDVIAGELFTVRVAPFEVADGLHVPLTIQRYLYEFMLADAELIFIVAVVTFV